MTRTIIERHLCHAQLELYRMDDQALEEAHKWLVRALIALEQLRHPHDTVNACIELALKEPLDG